jgi:hypothetical protein
MAEKRLKRLAPAIKHYYAHHRYAVHHRGPWHRQRSSIPAPTGPRVTRCFAPEIAYFFETAVRTAVVHIGGIAANPLSVCGVEHG